MCVAQWESMDGPYCHVVFGVHPGNSSCKALFDTGASASIITRSQLERMYCSGGIIRDGISVHEHGVHMVNASEDEMPISHGAVVVCQIQGRLVTLLWIFKYYVIS